MVHYHVSHVDNRKEAEAAQYNLFGYDFVKKECHALFALPSERGETSGVSKVFPGKRRLKLSF